MTQRLDPTLRSPSGTLISLSPEEYRLALLGIVDYEGNWAGLEQAAAFVTDGPAKLDLIRERVRPLADLLSPWPREIETLEVLIARHWFRHGACQPRRDMPL